MKKSILFVAALMTAMVTFAEEVVINAQVDREVGEEATEDLLSVVNEWTSGTSYPTFMLDENIEVGTLSEGTENGVYYTTDKAAGDWRVYQARAVERNEVGDTISLGKFWLKAKNGAKITRVVFQYSTNHAKGGGLISRTAGLGNNVTDSIASNDPIEFENGTDEVVLYAHTSQNKFNAQVRIQKFIVFYETEETAIKLEVEGKKAVKMVRDGQVYIVRGDKTFNALGAQF